MHMLQIGALVPTGFDNPGWDGYGTVAWWNSQDAHWCHRELPGPRFLRHVPSREELKAHHDCKVHVRVDVSTEQAEEVQQQLASLPVFSGHTRIVADSQEKIQRLSAASAARSASTVGKALAEYIKKMPIPVGVDRDEVFAITKEYLDQG